MIESAGANGLADHNRGNEDDTTRWGAGRVDGTTRTPHRAHLAEGIHLRCREYPREAL